MVRIDWAQLCEMAFFDDCDRLCLIGVMTRFPAPALPIAMRQLMIAVRIADVEAGESFGIGVSMVTPGGVRLTPEHSDGFDIAMSAEYILITLREVPLAEEGAYRFAVSVGKGSPICIDVPVRLVPRDAYAGSNPRDRGGHDFAKSSRISGQGVN
jgi:hypothetical protein